MYELHEVDEIVKIFRVNEVDPVLAHSRDLFRAVLSIAGDGPVRVFEEIFQICERSVQFFTVRDILYLFKSRSVIHEEIFRVLIAAEIARLEAGETLLRNVSEARILLIDLARRHLSESGRSVRTLLKSKLNF